MNNHDSTQEQTKAPVVTFSNIPLDEEPDTPVGYDAIPDEALEPQTISVVDIQFKRGGKIYYFDPGTLSISAGEEVIIDTSRGAEYGFCAGGNHTVPKESVVSPLRPVIRIATENDKKTRKEFKDKEPAAFETCQQKILEHKLDMKLVSAEYSFDGSKILFYFTADGRVDFRDLVKDLAGVFRTRIELRQIGVRDEAKMLGGLGICGRPFCCKQFLEDFQPVSIKMAKTQNLSLNPTKISGTCGRLMCCLKYEQDAYESLLKTSPKVDSVVNTYDGVGTVTDSNLLKQSVKVRLNSDPSSVKSYNNCDICILRNGKAKKNDPPIPTDIPPLPKPEKVQPEPEIITMFDESILSNYGLEHSPSSEKTEHSGKTEQTKTQERPQETRAQRRGGNRSRSDKAKTHHRTGETKENKENKRPKQKADASAPSKEGKQEQKEQKEGKSRNYRRRYYRGGKKSSGGQNQG